MSAGIDYGRGVTNIDVKTGIRYGVISQYSVLQAWNDSAEPEYGEPTCPKCGNETPSEGKENTEYTCENCEYSFDSDEAFPDKAIGWSFEDNEYSLSDLMDNTEIFVLKSPYYTHAKYCSPCVPGAGDLNNPHPEGAKTYCLGEEWFSEDGHPCPYPIYKVSDDSLVYSPPVLGDEVSDSYKDEEV